MPRRKARVADPAFPTVLIDTREQSPYAFRSIPADGSDPGQLLHVHTEVRGLKSGDYSLDGFADLVAVERKSKADLFGTVGQGRDRFERELERLNAMRFAAVMVEAEWSEIMTSPPRHSQLGVKTISRSVLAWQQRYTRVHWHFWPTREVAEVVTFRILERFWKEELKRVNAHGGTDRGGATERGGDDGPSAVPEVRLDTPSLAK